MAGRTQNEPKPVTRTGDVWLDHAGDSMADGVQAVAGGGVGNVVSKVGGQAIGRIVGGRDGAITNRVSSAAAGDDKYVIGSNIVFGAVGGFLGVKPSAQNYLSQGLIGAGSNLAAQQSTNYFKGDSWNNINYANMINAGWFNAYTYGLGKRGYLPYNAIVWAPSMVGNAVTSKYGVPVQPDNSKDKGAK